MSKLIGGWCLLMLSLPLTFFWLKPDVRAGNDTAVLFKLFVLLAIVSAAALAVSPRVSRKWAQRTVQLQNFAAALPASETRLPEGGPEELQNLARAPCAPWPSVYGKWWSAPIWSCPAGKPFLPVWRRVSWRLTKILRVNFCNDAFAEAFNARTPVQEGRSLYEVVRETALRDILERVVTSGTA